MMRNPNTGRDDCRILVSMYEPVRDAIVAAVGEHEPLAFADLPAQVEQRTPPEMWADASLGWFTTTVKLHLEATGVLVREGSPQQLRLA